MLRHSLRKPCWVCTPTHSSRQEPESSTGGYCSRGTSSRGGSPSLLKAALSGKWPRERERGRSNGRGLASRESSRRWWGHLNFGNSLLSSIEKLWNSTRHSTTTLSISSWSLSGISKLSRRLAKLAISSAMGCLRGTWSSLHLTHSLLIMRDN